MTLELPPDQMRAMADEVAGRCIEFIASLPRQPIRGDVEAAEALCRALREPAPEQGEALGPLLDLLFDHCVPPSFNAASGGYLAFIPGGGLYPAALADFIANTVNRFTGVWMAAPALVQLEANALDWLRDWMGFPATTRGLFTTGGSMATFNAILCARERHLGADIRRGVLYTSDQAHHSVLKSAKLAGIMPDRVRGIPCDGNYRLPLDELRQAVQADRAAGLVPFAVVSSAGTTNTGAVDPLDAIADLCAAESLWHHVDGAYGAFFQLDPSLRETLRGLSRADSLTLDPHKGMFLPYGTGALLVRDGAALRAAHEATADYLPAMPHPEHFYDPSQHGPDLSRGLPGPARLAVREALRRGGLPRGDCREAPAHARRLRAHRGDAGHRHRRAARAVAVRVPRDLAGRDAAGRRRRDAGVDGADHRPRAGDGHRRGGAWAISGPRLRAELPHPRRRSRRAGRGHGRGAGGNRRRQIGGAGLSALAGTSRRAARRTRAGSPPGCSSPPVHARRSARGWARPTPAGTACRGRRPAGGSRRRCRRP